MDPVYLVPLFGGIILATYGYWLKKTDERVDNHESRLAGIEAILPKMDKQLDRIEEKLNGR
jgi:hypothetical protein